MRISSSKDAALNNNEKENIDDELDSNIIFPPDLSEGLSQDEQYFALLNAALRKCLSYKPKFGQRGKDGLTLQQFSDLYSADPFYHWLGLDSPLMYAAHKAAGGMTSIYRQIGIGSQWIFHQMLQDQLGLSPEQASWNYTIQLANGKERKFSLDGRIDLAGIVNISAQSRFQEWLNDISVVINLPKDTLANIKGVVFEVRQGYKSKDSKRQNADLANASKAYAHLYIPVILLFSTQIDAGIAHRYQENFWLLLTGALNGAPTNSAYSFCREVLGYDLADFFHRYSPKIRIEVENVLQTLLTA